MKPDFICIGAQKAETSWLFARLKSHPEFSMLPVKELHYFDRSPEYPSPNMLAKTGLGERLLNPGYTLKFAKAMGRCLKAKNLSRAKWWSRYYLRTYSDTWYRSLFENETGITGDITPSYSILSEQDVARMHSVAPDAKLLLMMRDPVDRAWSMYRFQEKYGGTIDLGDLDDFKKFVDSPAQALRSNYLRTIELFLKHYDPSQLLLGYYDAIIDQPDELLSAVLKHFGAKTTSEHTGLKQVNNKSRQVEMPGEYRGYLESKYRGDLDELARRFGGYSKKWLSSISSEESQLADGPEGYPPVVHL